MSRSMSAKTALNGFVADGGEMGVEVAMVAPVDTPAGLLRFAQLCQGLRGVTPQRVDRDVTGPVAAPSHSRNCSKVGFAVIEERPGVLALAGVLQHERQLDRCPGCTMRQLR